MNVLPSFENFSYQVNPFGLMEDFEVENFVPESDSNSESPIEKEEEESAEEENREEANGAKGGVYTKVKKVLERLCIGDLSGRQIAKKIEEEKRRGKFAETNTVTRFYQALQEARGLFVHFCDGDEPSEEHASTMRSHKKYQVCTMVS